jgi:hypothetical protein
MLPDMGSEHAVDTQDYAGARVVLTWADWHGHVIPAHPEVGDSIDAVGDTIRDPTFVFESKLSPDTRLFHRLGAIPSFRNLYLTVVIRFEFEPARVMTVYVTKEPSGSSGRLLHVSARHRH